MPSAGLIPEITDERLAELSARIKPVVRFAKGRSGKFKSPEGKLYYIESPAKLRNYSFLWDAKPTKRAKGLERIDEIVTYHEYGAPSLFKPAVDEVLAQIPERFLKRCVAFEIVNEAMSGEYHATTVLYMKS